MAQRRRANFFAHKARQHSDIETTNTTARPQQGNSETDITSAPENCTKNAHFSPAKAMAVSTPHAHERAKAMTVSRWPASAVAEVMAVSQLPRGCVLCAKKFALLGLMVGVSAKKFALRTKNGP